MTKNLISYVEAKLVPSLLKECQNYFVKSGMSLPSHDHLHHLRVWNISKELILGQTEPTTSMTSFDSEFLRSLSIAIFFHDVGMTEDISENHGKVSSEFCQCFLSNGFKHVHNKKVECQLLDGIGEATQERILTAIKKHDLKNENYSTLCSCEDQKKLLFYLSISDDLDALGNIGIFRYFEIYFKRRKGDDFSDLDKVIESISSAVCRNVKHRYQNFTDWEDYITLSSDIKQKYELKRDVIYDFYADFCNNIDVIEFFVSILEEKHLVFDSEFCLRNLKSDDLEVSVKEYLEEYKQECDI